MMQNDFGLISIIMAAYNAEKTIEQAINSVLSQTYTDFELLVVNDCSKDRTVELVKDIVAKDSRVRLISNVKNSGVSYTRKHGLEEAKGDWIAILDSDDKKSAVEAVGSYQDFYLLEDYYLWLRMLMAGYQGYNIQESLLHMRAGSDMYLRRAGWKYAKTQAKLFEYMKEQGFIGNGQYIKSCVIRSGSALAPNWLRKFMFEKVLRKC